MNTLQSLWSVCLIALCLSACSKDVDPSQKLEREKLEQLYQEIEDLSSSVSCDDATKWTIIPIGSKACGGPNGFVAYSTEIDVPNFLGKVEYLTEFENQYNKKWGIVSDCSLRIAPTGVKCVNGKPELYMSHMYFEE